MGAARRQGKASAEHKTVSVGETEIKHVIAVFCSRLRKNLRKNVPERATGAAANDDVQADDEPNGASDDELDAESGDDDEDDNPQGERDAASPKARPMREAARRAALIVGQPDVDYDDPDDHVARAMKLCSSETESNPTYSPTRDEEEAAATAAAATETNNPSPLRVGKRGFFDGPIPNAPRRTRRR